MNKTLPTILGALIALTILPVISTVSIAGEPAIAKQTEQTLIRELAFKDAAIDDVVDYLRAVSREADPKGIGINIVVIPPKKRPVAARAPANPRNLGNPDPFNFFDDGEPVNIVPAVPRDRRITINLRRVSLRTALDLVCDVANLEWKIKKGVIVITEPGAIQPDEMKTVFYPLQDPEMLNKQLRQMKQGQRPDPINPFGDPFAPPGAKDPFGF